MRSENSEHENKESIICTAKKILLDHPLCDRCLGRLFASYGLDLTNAMRGRAIKTLIAMEVHRSLVNGDERALDELRRLAANGGEVFEGLARRYLGVPEGKSCEICGGRLDRLIGDLTNNVLEGLRNVEASTFLIGVKKGSKIEEKEKELALSYGLKSWESIRREVKREVGKRIQSVTGLKPDFKSPDVVFLIDLDKEDVDVVPQPLYLYGTYVKLGRYITQMKWIGKEGRNFPFSVEESVKKSKAACKASDVIMHASGREDADARMLGEGRPLVLEFKKPLKRFLNFANLNKLGSSPPWVLLNITKVAEPSLVRKIKEIKYRKVYRAITFTPGGIDESDVEKVVREFKNREVRQRTPTRVLRRRADKIRKRKVYEVRGLRLSGHIADFLIRCEGGLYVKELVNGDNGRTEPSFTSVIGKKTVVVFLDILKHEGP